ncbi:hypothetical protein GCM10009120_26560 [Sphingobacterium siyangense subsp. cladoniae]|uniref:hypothetical protein n=1 Tax=Sphingobacterium siyangense TaxID=459529 RepID=UPI0031F80A08
MKNFAILFLLICINLSLIAQGTLADKKAPFNMPDIGEASTLTPFGGSNVDLYNGKVSPSIPIYILKGRDLSVDIGLNYISGNGVKVQDVAGIVGLGWSLSSGGGVITRKIRDEPDDQNTSFALGYGVHNNDALYGDTTSSGFKNYLKRAINSVENSNVYDLEPDEFHSSIGGKITFGMNKNPVFSDEKGFKILKNGLYAPDSTWVILDKSGNTYYFGKKAVEREHKQTGDANSSTGDANPSPTYVRTFISAWYLSEIKSPTGEIISFTYEKGDRECNTYYSKTNEMHSVASGNQLFPVTSTISSVCKVDPVYLKYIKSNTHQVHFIYNNRLDNPNSKCLSQILVEDLTGLPSKVFQFNYGYFKGGTSGNSAVHLKLLGLDQLNTQETARLPLATFKYFEPTSFPDRYSSQMDHWGYFNANTSGKWFLSEGADKAANLEKAKTGIIKSITWGMGGTTTFEYALNSFMQDGVELLGGGLRLLNMTNSHDQTSYTTTYDYKNASGKTSGLLHGYFSNNLYNRETYYNIRNSTDDLFSFQGTGTIENSSPLTNFFDQQGSAVGYSEVTVGNPDGSKIKNFYIDRNQYNEVVEGAYNVSDNVVTKTDDSYYNTVKGFYDFPSKNEGLIGSLKEQQIINSQTKLVKKTVWEYRLVKPTDGLSSLGMQKRLTSIYNSQQDFRQRKSWHMIYYNNRNFIPQLLIKKEYSYSSDGIGKVTETAARYVYKAFSYMPSQVITSTAATDSSVLEYRYPLQASTNVSDINYKLYEKNILTPVETVIKIKTGSVEKTIGSTANVYADFNGKLMLQSQYSLDLKTPISDFSYMVGPSLDSRYNLKTIYDKYANTGELLQYHENFGPPVSLVWGMKNSLLLAKIAGMSYDEVKANIDTLNLNKLTATQNFVTTEIGKIRALNKTLDITSNYTHPITGVLMNMDNTGKSETYAYDQFGRLLTVKDTKQNITKDYIYNIFDTQANDQDITKWIKTGNTRCIVVNGATTGEEEVEERYTDPSNSNNGNLRWRSIGFTNKCMVRNTYVKLTFENQEGANIMAPEIHEWTQIADVVVRFYSDAAGTIPQPLTASIKINLESKINGVTKTNTFNADALGQPYFKYGRFTISSNWENIMTGESGVTIDNKFKLLPGTNYTIIN